MAKAIVDLVPSGPLRGACAGGLCVKAEPVIRARAQGAAILNGSDISLSGLRNKHGGQWEDGEEPAHFSIVRRTPSPTHPGDDSHEEATDDNTSIGGLLLPTSFG